MPSPTSRTRRFLMLGSTGGHNQGDDALISRNMEMLQSAFPGCRFLMQTRSEERTRRTFATFPVETIHGGDLRFLSPALIREALRCDAVVACGGIYFSHSIFRLRYGFVGSMPPLLWACRRAGIPTLALNVGVQQPPSALGAIQLRWALNLHEQIVLRDPQDAAVLERICVRTPYRVSADSALVPGKRDPPQALAALGWNERPARLLGWNLTRHMHLPAGANRELGKPLALARQFAEAIRDVSARLDAHALLVATVREDHEFLTLVAKELGDPVRVSLAPFQDAETTRQCIGLCDLFVGTRLHSLIFASVQGVPPLALPYRPKSAQYIGLVGLPAEFALMDWWTSPGAIAGPTAAAWDARGNAKRIVERFVAECEPKTRWGVEWLAQRLGMA